MTAPAITAALEELIATTPPPVTVWGVRYPEAIEFVDIPAGYIDWAASEAEAREWLAEEQAADCPVELVRLTGRAHVEG